VNYKEIIAQDIKKHFYQGEMCLMVLQGVSMHLKKGNTYAITGPSGSGKSTLLHILAGLDSPTTGHVFFNDIDIYALSASQRNVMLHKSIGLMFQLPYLIRELSVLENVMLKGSIAGEDRAMCEEKAHVLLERVGLAHKARSNISALSGGQQQRVALIRAIFGEPSFLFADEPTGSLDEHTAESIVDLLEDCCNKRGMGIIVSTHDPLVYQRMETIFQLKDGILVEK